MPFLSYQDEHWSFLEAWEAASRIGHVLVHDCGVIKGDRVAIAMRNYPEWVLAFTAVTSIGAIAVAMNAHWQADEMGYALTDSGARVMLADQERLSRLISAPPGLQVLAVRPSLPLAPGVRLLATLTDAAPAVMSRRMMQ
jgi:long-chain acyl-CoA synthetase